VLRNAYWGGVNLSIVFYYGKKYGADKSLFLTNADLFVFPTSYPNECFPLVLLEAMERALPCVSTNEGGIADIIEDGKTGHIVPRNDAEALAGRIETLLNDPTQRIRLGKNAREKFKREFTLGKFEETLTNILEKVSWNF